MKAFIALCALLFVAAVGFFALALCRAVGSAREAEHAMLMDVCCDGCRHYLGGGHCRINLEKECADGDFEAWEEEEHAEP